MTGNNSKQIYTWAFLMDYFKGRDASAQFDLKFKISSLLLELYETVLSIAK